MGSRGLLFSEQPARDAVSGLLLPPQGVLYPEKRLNTILTVLLGLIMAGIRTFAAQVPQPEGYNQLAREFA